MKMAQQLTWYLIQELSKSKNFVKFFLLFAHSVLSKVSSLSAHFPSLQWGLDSGLILMLKVFLYGLSGSLALVVLALFLSVKSVCWFPVLHSGSGCLVPDPSGLPDRWLQCKVCDWFFCCGGPSLTSATSCQLVVGL